VNAVALRRVLASRWLLVIAAALAIALTLPTLGNGLEIDDHLFRARIVGDHWSPARTARELFVYANPDHPEEVTEAMTRGELPWWAAPRLRWGFMRPVPALLHHAEMSAFEHGGVAWMHLHSVLWFAALVLGVGALYRRLIGSTWIAGLATLLYAVDDGHGFTVGWLANRGSILAALAGVLALIAHDRWVRERWRPGTVLGPVAVAITLACSEEGVAVIGFIVAFQLTLATGSLRRRLAALSPYVAVLVAWEGARSLLGFGLDGTGSYTDPLRHPIAFALQALERIPILIHSELGALPADLWEVYFVRHDLAWLMALVGVVFVAVMALVFVPLLRGDRLARFWALGGGLGLIAVSGAHPADRHLLLISVAGAALVARFLAAWFARRDPGEAQLLPRSRRGAAVAAVCLLVVHTVLAPILLPIRGRIPGAVSRGVARIDALLPSDPALADQDLVLVNVPFKYLGNHASVVRRSNGGVSPRRFRCLGVSPDEVVVSRPDERSLVLRPARGLLRFFEDTNVRARWIPFAIGDRIELPDFTVIIRAITADGRPAEIEFRFAVGLEDPSLRWLTWAHGQYQTFTPPPVGTTLTLASDPFAFADLLGAPR
jgi:hypothetical protein